MSQSSGRCSRRPSPPRAAGSGTGFQAGFAGRCRNAVWPGIWWGGRDFHPGEVAVHDGDRCAIGVGEGAPDETALGVFLVGTEALEQAQWRLARAGRRRSGPFLTMEVHVVAQCLNFSQWELLVSHFGFLQADHVRLVLFDQRGQLMGPGAQAVDVERDDLHGSNNPGKSQDAS